jgi:hypothetical protein
VTYGLRYYGLRYRLDRAAQDNDRVVYFTLPQRSLMIMLRKTKLPEQAMITAIKNVGRQTLTR